MAQIKPRTLSGFMELLPARQVQFDRMVEILRKSYSLYGFTPLDTPAIEAAEVLLAKGGGETEKQIYRFLKGDTDLGQQDLAGLDEGGVQGGEAVETVGAAEDLHHPVKLGLPGGEQLHKAGQGAGLYFTHGYQNPFFGVLSGRIPPCGAGEGVPSCSHRKETKKRWGDLPGGWALPSGG